MFCKNAVEVDVGDVECRILGRRVEEGDVASERGHDGLVAFGLDRRRGRRARRDRRRVRQATPVPVVDPQLVEVADVVADRVGRRVVLGVARVVAVGEEGQHLGGQRPVFGADPGQEAAELVEGAAAVAERVARRGVRRRLAAAAPAPLLAVLADGDRGAAERRAVEVPDGRVAGLGRRELHDAAALGAAVGVGRHARVDDVEAGLAEEVLQVVPLHGRVEARDEDARPLEVAAAGVARAVAREVARLAALVAELLGLPPPRRRPLPEAVAAAVGQQEVLVERARRKARGRREAPRRAEARRQRRAPHTQGSQHSAAHRLQRQCVAQ